MVLSRLVFFLMLGNTTVSSLLENDVIYGKRQNGTKLSILSDFGPKLCVKTCFERHSHCSSVNFNLQKLECELNVIGEEETLIEESGFMFINVSGGTFLIEDLRHCNCGEKEVCSKLRQGSFVCTQEAARDCDQLSRQGVKTNGVYRIYPTSDSVDAYCDMNMDGGRWTRIIHRIYPFSLSFGRNWADYRDGFGDPWGEHWLGNKYLHSMTKSRFIEVHFSLLAPNGTWYWASYSGFSVGPESDGFILDFNENTYKGTAGESLHTDVVTEPAKGMKFSTYDNDNDNYYGNCAYEYDGGWWHNHCSLSMITSYSNCQWMWFFNIGHIKDSVVSVRPIH